MRFSELNPQLINRTMVRGPVTVTPATGHPGAGYEMIGALTGAYHVAIPVGGNASLELIVLGTWRRHAGYTYFCAEQAQEQDDDKPGYAMRVIEREALLTLLSDLVTVGVTAPSLPR